MESTARATVDSMQIPGTFEVYEATTGRWQGTFTEFKTAEATADLLNSRNAGQCRYTWRPVR